MIYRFLNNTYCSESVYLDLFPGYVLLRVGIYLTCFLGCTCSGSVYLNLFTRYVLLWVGIYLTLVILGSIAQGQVYLDLFTLSMYPGNSGSVYFDLFPEDTYCSGSVYLDLFPGNVSLRVGIYLTLCNSGLYCSGSSIYLTLSNTTVCIALGRYILDLFPGYVLLWVGIILTCLLGTYCSGSSIYLTCFLSNTYPGNRVGIYLTCFLSNTYCRKQGQGIPILSNTFLGNKYVLLRVDIS